MITADLRAAMRRMVLVEGWRIQTVARHFGVHHGTVRRALRDDVPAPKVAGKSGLDPFKPYLIQRLTDLPELSAVRLFSEIQKRGYQRSITLLRDYVAQVRRPRHRKAYLRVEPEPGEQAQVDWGSFGFLRVGGTQRPLSVFSMVLSWSRTLFIDFSLDQQMETFLRMHLRALEAFGGIPRKILYDNLKSVVLHHVGSVVQFNPRFLAFAGHYLFEPVAAPVRYPEAKGRVEASIKFIRHGCRSDPEGVRKGATPLLRWRDFSRSALITGGRPHGRLPRAQRPTRRSAELRPAEVLPGEEAITCGDLRGVREGTGSGHASG